ncbi:MAG TPA: peptidase M20, partial [Burkholderiales bacterium]|nr:peptidase M20 [Burkholderiales bacterium]
MKIGQFWDDAIVPTLVDYIRIPAKSPHFDNAWSKNGYIDAAVELAAGWCRKNALPGMGLEVVRLENRTPVLLIEVPAFQTSSTKTVLMYGHLDKQPEMVGWREG